MSFYLNSTFILEFNLDQTFCSTDLTTNSENKNPKFSRTFLDCDRYRLTNIFRKRLQRIVANLDYVVVFHKTETSAQGY